MLDAYIHAQLDSHPSADRDGVVWDRQVGQVLARFAADHPDWVNEEIEFIGAQDERSTRRWCWAVGWTLISQDEDLLLMNEPCDAWLLDEALRGAPKGPYAVSIVAHAVRDGLHAALWPAKPAIGRGRTGPIAGAEVHTAVDTAIARASRVANTLAGSTFHHAFEYARRLAGYGERRKVDRAEASQRVLDVRRCHPREDVPVELERRGKTWIASLKRAGLEKGHLFIQAGDGRMWASTSIAR